MTDSTDPAADAMPPRPLKHLALQLPTPVRLLLALHVVASLAHFVHNAEAIAFYPNMPPWITPGDVYRAWLGITGVVAVGLLLLRLGHRRTGIALIAIYGAMGLDGLGHYALAACAAHTLAANLTIGAEAVSGVLLALACLWLLVRESGGRASAQPHGAA